MPPASSGDPGRDPAVTPPRTSLLPTAYVDAVDLAAARALLDEAFEDDFTDLDWSHALGGLHALVHVDDVLVGHAALVLRRLMVGTQVLRCGYVEAVAVRPESRREGHGARLMDALEALAPGYDLLALGATDQGRGLYDARGWVPWGGSLHALTPRGVEATPEEEGAVLVLLDRGGQDDPHRLTLDLDAPLTCDWREGDVW